jgi:hypothetical protein
MSATLKNKSSIVYTFLGKDMEDVSVVHDEAEMTDVVLAVLKH